MTPLPTLSTITSKLEAAYGPPVRDVQRPEPVDELVSTILSQHTSDTNTARAFSSLKERFPCWDDVINAPVDSIVDAIRSGGLARQKALRIQRALTDVRAKGGGSDLSFLARMPVDDALAWLTALHGVGPKTAACVLLFSLDRPVMPVDTHVHRVSLRLGLLEAGTSADGAHGKLEAGLTASEVYVAHMLLIKHGRKTCKARAPRCGQCVLRDDCPSATIYLSKEPHDVR